jgi:ribonuclease HII
MSFRSLLQFDRRWAGDRLLAGVDEAGRGALAGPVVAAAVMLPRNDRRRMRADGPLGKVKDSKLLRPESREVLYEKIVSVALAWSVGRADPAEIDEINILQASLVAMRRAVDGLRTRPEVVLVDGLHVPPAVGVETRAAVEADGRSLSVACASIVAKVTRDRHMRELGRSDPRFGWVSNKGYATAEHRRALVALGGTSLHRTTFLRNLDAWCQQELFEEGKTR